MAGDRLDLGTARNRLPNMSLNPLNRSVGVRLRGGGLSGKEIFLFFQNIPKYLLHADIFCQEYILLRDCLILQNTFFPENLREYIIFWKTFEYTLFRKSSKVSFYSCSEFSVH